MFELVISKQEFVAPLLAVASAVDKKQSMAILSNTLLRLKEGTLWLTATDLEIEMTARIPCQMNQQEGEITLPAKKMVDIVRSFDDDAQLTINSTENLVTISSGRSRFKMGAMPAQHYPRFKEEQNDIEFSLSREALIHLFQTTGYAISQQDVRAYLNGLFIEVDAHSITGVAMDGHRMAVSRIPCDIDVTLFRFLLPKKSVQEVLRLLNAIDEELIDIAVGKNHFKLTTKQYTFSSKLIDARFPLYSKAIPRDQDKQVVVDSDLLKRTLSRIIILAPEKSRGVLMHIEPNQLTLVANNQEREEATETFVAQTQVTELKVGVNASYLLDLLHHIKSGPLRFSLKDADSSILIEPLLEEHYQYVLMPMKL